MKIPNLLRRLKRRFNFPATGGPTNLIINQGLGVSASRREVS